MFIYDSEISIRKPPINLARKDDHLFVSEYLKIIGPSFFKKTTDVTIFNDKTVNFNPGKLASSSDEFDFYDQIFVDTGLISKVNNEIKHFAAIFLPKLRLNSGLWVINHWSHGYFHWITESLAKISILHEINSDLKVLLPSSYQEYKFIRQSLDFLKIEYRFLPLNRLTYITNLYFGYFAYSSGNYSYSIMKSLAEKFETKRRQVNSPLRRIWISRALAQKRSIENESQLYPILLKYGFEILNLEIYTFSEQVDICQSAEILAGLHGAGLTNMTFMPKGGKIIEIRRRGDNHSNCYFSLASIMDHKYYYLLADSLSSDLHQGNCILDSELLEKFLRVNI